VLLFFPFQKYVHFRGHYEKKNAPNMLKIITYNTHYGNKEKNLKELDEYILKQNADIVFFQEIYTRQWRSSEALLTDHYNAVFDLVGISSKYPIINKQKIILPGKGYACLADISLEDDTLRCFNLYLEPMSLKKSLFKPESTDDVTVKTKAVTEKLSDGFKKHQVQADILSRYIQESPYPVIVCGDFNSVPMSYEYFLIKDGLQDVFEQSGRGLGMTFYDYFYPIRIDCIFIDGNKFISKDCYVDKSVKFSDHYPVVAEIQIK
jgi:endonuclease/exonuclease/phosphatase family metal-dependent hydrolase